MIERTLTALGARYLLEPLDIEVIYRRLGALGEEIPVFPISDLSFVVYHSKHVVAVEQIFKEANLEMVDFRRN